MRRTVGLKAKPDCYFSKPIASKQCCFPRRVTSNFSENVKCDSVIFMLLTEVVITYTARSRIAPSRKYGRKVSLNT